MYKDAQLLPVEFSKGIDAWNREALLGVKDSLATPAYQLAHPMQNREHAPGYVDDICNFDFTDDGKLIQRSNLLPYQFASTRYPAAGNDRTALLCTHEAYMDTNVNAHTWVLQIRNDATGASEFYRRTDGNPWFTKTVGTVTHCVALFYNATWWFYRQDANAAFKVTSGPTVTDFTPNYANGTGGVSEIFLWKDRAWGRQGNTIVFSKATDPQIWAVPDGGFFQLPTKGNIKSVKIFNDQLYIMDSVNNVWVFSYTSDPNQDGVLVQIIPATDIPLAVNVGAPQGPSRHMCVSKGDIYIAGGNNIYQVVNNRLYPIADQLHLDLAGRDELYLFNLGDKLMAVSYYWGVDSKNMRCYIYHHNVRAWTRYHFDFGDSALETDKVYIEQAQFYQRGYQNSVVMTLNGAQFNGLNDEYKPVYVMHINEPFFGGSMHDQIINVYDGTGGRVYKAPKLILDTGPIYAGEKDVYKKFLEVRVDAHFGFRQEGTTFEDKPFEASIIPVPLGSFSVSNFDWQRLDNLETSEFPYRAMFNQIARGLKFYFTNSVEESWAAHQDAFTLSETVLSRAYISKIAVRLRSKTRLRAKGSGTAMADANDV